MLSYLEKKAVTSCPLQKLVFQISAAPELASHQNIRKLGVYMHRGPYWSKYGSME